MESRITGQNRPGHPLEPLSAWELQSAVELLRGHSSFHSAVRFVSVMLQEPQKDAVLGFQAGSAWDRQAFAVLLDNSSGMAYEAVVSLTSNAVVSWKEVPGVQPSIFLDEFLECEEAVKKHPDYRAALKKRGVEDMGLVMVDPWSAGNFGMADEEGVRLSRALSWVRSSPGDNGYARPIEGVIAVVDLNRMEVVRIEDYGVVPLPPEDGNYAPDRIGRPLRNDLRPLEVIQPEGPSFEVEGHEVSWQKWRIRFGFTPREGLVLHTVSYRDETEERPILYRASLSEMVVPYGDPGPNHNRQNAFDAGEYGLGMLANSLELGCDCLGLIRYFDAHLVGSRGDVISIPNAICMHEEDYGTLWKHTDWRTGEVEVRRSRRLVLSSISTVANYEYGFFWYFYLDGTIQMEVKLTGVVNTAAVPAGTRPKYASLIAPQLAAPIHQHFFNVRLDMMVDGVRNTVCEVDTEAEPPGPGNPFGNAFFAKTVPLRTELSARRRIDPARGRFWKIINPNRLNRLGEPVGYKLSHGENVLPFADAHSSLIRRAGFIAEHLWVTPFRPDERYAAGNYPNQHPGVDGLPRWTAEDRPIENTDVVVWYTMGHHHVARPEDWPVMPVAYIGFSLKPSGFFDANPALDVPPSKPAQSRCCGV